MSASILCPDLLSDSPTARVTVQGQLFYIKRDDRLHPLLNGNKARKFFYLFQQDPKIKSIVSFGGNQSNAMIALSALAKLKGWRFDYYLKKLPQQLLDYPVGNFKTACEYGMVYHEVDRFPDLSSSLDCLVIQQGGSSSDADVGVARLGEEINQWAANQRIEGCCVFLPSGTGTTAFYLQQHTHLPVYTTPCVGNADYLRRQWQNLASGHVRYPAIIFAPCQSRFGQPSLQYFDLWKQLLADTAIEFDLLYDPVGWMAVLNNRHLLPQNVLYIHCGGTTGNESMLLRYKYLFKRNH